MTTSVPGSAGRMIALGSQVAAALDPERPATTDLPVTPMLAALSLLSSGASFWEAHALTVAFAVDTVGDDPPRVVERLASRERLSTWFVDDDFLRYLDRQYVQTNRPGLVRAAEFIEIGLDRVALQAAQFGTVKIEYCIRQCGDDLDCLARCLAS